MLYKLVQREKKSVKQFLFLSDQGITFYPFISFLNVNFMQNLSSSLSSIRKKKWLKPNFLSHS